MVKKLIKYEVEGSEEGIVKGAFSLTLSMLIVKVLGLIYKIPLSYILSDEGMGYFNSAYTVYTFFYLICNSGIPKAISIMTTESFVKKRFADERKIFITALSVIAFFGIFLSFVFVIFSRILGQIISSPSSALAMVAVAPSVIFIALAGVIRGYLNGRARLLPIAISQVIEGAGRLGFGLAFSFFAVRLQLSLPYVAAFAIFGVTIGSVLGLIYLSISVKVEKQHYNTEQKTVSNLKICDILKRLLKVAVPITASAAVMSISNIIDLGIIMSRLSDIGYSEEGASVLYGNYATLCVPMFNLVAAIISPIAVAALPLFGKHFALNDKMRFKETLKGAIDLGAFLTVPCAFGCMFFAEDVLKILFDDASAALAAPLLTLLAPAMIFMTALTVVNTALEAVGLMSAPLISMSFGAVAKIAITYCLVGNEAYGIIGAPIGTTVFYLTSLVVSFLIMITKTEIPCSAFSAFVLPGINALLSTLLVKLGVGYLAERFNIPINGVVIIVFCAALYMIFSFITGAFSIKRLKIMSEYTKRI